MKLTRHHDRFFCKIDIYLVLNPVIFLSSSETSQFQGNIFNVEVTLATRNNNFYWSEDRPHNIKFQIVGGRIKIFCLLIIIVYSWHYPKLIICAICIPHINHTLMDSFTSIYKCFQLNQFSVEVFTWNSSDHSSGRWK